MGFQDNTHVKVTLFCACRGVETIICTYNLLYHMKAQIHTDSQAQAVTRG